MYALTHQLQVERRESHRANQVYASPHTSYRWKRREIIEPIKCMALTTHQLQVGEERVIEPIKCMLHTHQLQVERRESHRANQVEWRSPHTSLQV